jgi:hypothetical protein
MYTLALQDRSRSAESFHEFTEQTAHAAHAPWRAEQFPPLANWLKQNESPLDLVIQASERPQYYSPVLVTNQGPGVGGGPLVGMLLPDVQHARDLARALCYRAMLQLGEGRPREAWRDLEAAHRLARLVSQTGPLVSHLVGIAIDQMALRADAMLLHDPSLTAEELQEIRSFLLALSPPCNMRRGIDTFERLMALDSIVHLARHGAGGQLPAIGNLLLQTGINWNIPLEMANGWYDKLDAALDHPTIAERNAAMAAIDTEIQGIVGQFSAGTIAKALFSGRERSEAVGEVFLALFLPAISAAQHAEDRTATSLRLLQVAAALAIHRAEEGAYPAALDSLPPPLLEGLPVDPFTEKPFHYELRGDGYVLWSVGRDFQDDKASGELFCNTLFGEYVPDDQLRNDDHDDHDDLVLRVPWSRPIERQGEADGNEGRAE